jgi:hypothetical protein
VVWERSIATAPVGVAVAAGLSPITPGGDVILVSTANMALAIDATTGQQLWQAELAGTNHNAAPALSLDTGLAIFGSEGGLQAFAISTVQLPGHHPPSAIWWRTPGDVTGSPAIAGALNGNPSDDVVYALTFDGKVHAFAVADGSALWTWQLLPLDGLSFHPAGMGSPISIDAAGCVAFNGVDAAYRLCEDYPPQEAPENEITQTVVAPGDMVYLLVAATDPNPGDTVRYELGPDAPNWLLIDPETGAITGVAPPSDPRQQGGNFVRPTLFTFTALARDNHGLTSAPIALTVLVGTQDFYSAAAFGLKSALAPPLGMDLDLIEYPVARP